MTSVRILAITMSLLCAACIPIAKMTTYEPEMASALVRADACMGWKSLEYRAGSAVLTASIERWPHVRHAYPALRLQIRAAAGDKVEFDAANLQLQSPHLPNPLPIPMGDGRVISLAAVPEGDLRIQLPDLIVNGEHHRLPLMSFVRQAHALALLPLNC